MLPVTSNLTEIRERPILFKGDMVRALLSGTKTQTRRVMTPQPVAKNARTEWYPPGSKYIDHLGLWAPSFTWNSAMNPLDTGAAGIRDSSPYGRAGERIWVREAVSLDWSDRPVYKADDPTGRAARDAGYSAEPRFRPSIHMPRRASRITLEITEVRVQRIEEISDEDIKAEGISEYVRSKGLDISRVSRRAAWIDLWDNINGKREDGAFAWDRNPWTWVITFERIEPN